MKTIQFTGTQYKIDNLHLALGISDNDMPQQMLNPREILLMMVTITNC